MTASGALEMINVPHEGWPVANKSCSRLTTASNCLGDPSPGLHAGVTVVACERENGKGHAAGELIATAKLTPLFLDLEREKSVIRLPDHGLCNLWHRGSKGSDRASTVAGISRFSYLLNYWSAFNAGGGENLGDQSKFRAFFSAMAMAMLCSAGGRSCSSFQRSNQAGTVNSPSPLPRLSFTRGKDGEARRGTALVVCARKGISSRTRGSENRGKKEGSTSTRPKEEASEGNKDGSLSSAGDGLQLGTDGGSSMAMPELPGLTTDFWEGSKWETFGFVVQYLWAFGIVFALIACGIAVATYNEGATDFKETTVYKESTQSQDFLEEPDLSSSDVFEVNPTEVAPSVD
ncbi:AT-rich interactive domain protein [Wolffia australiana]